MRKKSANIAVGGVFSALCLALMFMSGFLPFLTYAIPAFAGAMLIAVVIEMGPKTALMVYVSVSVLSMLIVADKEAAIMFVLFFGYYPIIKQKLDNIKWRFLQIVCKFVVFNAAIVGAYLLIIYVMGYAEIITEFSDLGKYGALIMLAMGNVVFALYDVALVRFASVYMFRIRDKFIKR